MRRPNFFIIGAPKCGTTAISEYLRSHPNVFFSTPKEPFHFCRDVLKATKYLVQTEEEYLGLFRKAESHHTALGEGSVYYLYSGQAVRLIREFTPDAKLIVQVRRPVDLVFSLYYQNIRNATENAPDFETAWRWQADRLHGKRLPRARRHNPALSQYKDIGMLGAQLQRVLGIFPRDQVHVIVYDDLSSHAEKVYSDLLEFLGLQHDGRAAFETVNARRAIRSPAFQRCLINLSYLNPVATAIHVAHKVFGAERFNLLGNIERFNLGRWRTPPRLSEPFEEELVEHFREDVLLLSDLIQHDLSHWNEVSSSTHREKGTHFQRGSEASQAIV